MRTAKEMESDENEVEEGKDLEEQFLMDGPTNPIVDLIDPHRINAKAPESIIESPQMGHPASIHFTSSSASMLSQKWSWGAYMQISQSTTCELN